jgi:hypothetical protein
MIEGPVGQGFHVILSHFPVCLPNVETFVLFSGNRTMPPPVPPKRGRAQVETTCRHRCVSFYLKKLARGYQVSAVAQSHSPGGTKTIDFTLGRNHTEDEQVRRRRGGRGREGTLGATLTIRGVPQAALLDSMLADAHADHDRRQEAKDPFENMVVTEQQRLSGFFACATHSFARPRLGTWRRSMAWAKRTVPSGRVETRHTLSSPGSLAESDDDFGPDSDTDAPPAEPRKEFQWDSQQQQFAALADANARLTQEVSDARAAARCGIMCRRHSSRSAR